MRVRDAMTPAPTCCAPESPLSTVAALMRDGMFGGVPVCVNEKVVGVITDRDIACRAVAEKKNPRRMVAADIMTRLVVTTTADTLLDQAIQLMEQERIRRLPVVDEEQRLIGILSASDVAAVSDLKGGELYRTVSEPSLWKAKMRVAL